MSYPLNHIYSTHKIPTICDDCISKIKEAYKAYFADDALDELECLLKSFNTPTTSKITVDEMKSIYDGNIFPKLDKDVLSLSDEEINLQPFNDVNSRNSNVKPSSNSSCGALTEISFKYSDMDYKTIALEAAKLMMARKNRHMETAITMAWKKFSVQKLAALDPTASYILIEKPDTYAMTILVNDIIKEENNKHDK